MSIYPQPTKTLMREFVAAELTPGKVFSKDDAVRWFAQHYPKIKSITVQMHVNGMSINNRQRKHHTNIKPGSGHDLFYKLGPNAFRLWDAEKDEPPFYASTSDVDESADEMSADVESEEFEDREDGPIAREFALESDLRNYISRNLSVIESGLRLYEDEGITGIEFAADGRRIDILCQDRDGHFVVLELKVSRGYDRVMGQILRYMAWVKKNLADDKPVRGMIVASHITSDLKLAASLVPDVSLVEYEISFQLKRVS